MDNPLLLVPRRQYYGARPIMARGSKPEKVTDLKGWQTSKQVEYSPDHFYTVSQDEKGHSANTQVPYPKDVSAVLQEWIESDDLPAYRTRADIFRDGLRHLLELRTKEPARRSQAVEEAKLRLDLQRWRDEQESRKALFHDAEVGLREAKDNERRADLARVLRARQVSREVRDELERIIERYGE